MVLVIRSSVRVTGSVIAVGTISALLTRVVPFHQVNAEIAARTTPTALDLGIAVFCAMAGVFATMRPASDVATTAAGTSIGISLVPPLCVSGYGIGTDSASVARGAALLFLTNFAAIVLVATVAFAALGFGRSDTARLEADELDAAPGSLLARPRVRSVMRRLRGGPWLRLLMPVALLAALYSPLRRGLDEVAWQITARGRVDGAIADLQSRVVQAQVTVERGRIQVVIFLLGSQADALAARERLVRDISAAGDVVPVVEVFAVPDATEFEALERSTQRPPLPIVAQPAPPVVEAPPPLRDLMAEATERVRTAVEARWPGSAGEILRVDLDTRADERIALRVVYLGDPLDAATVEALIDILSEDVGADVTLSAEDLPAAPVTLDGDDAMLAARLAVYMDRARAIEDLRLCLQDAKPAKGRRVPPVAPGTKALLALLGSRPGVVRIEGSRPAAWFSSEGCQPAPAPAAVE